MKINDNFKKFYMQCDNWSNDNVVIVNCSFENLKKIEESFLRCLLDFKTLPCIVKIGREMECRLEKTLDYFSRDLYRDFLTSDFINSLIVLEILKVLKLESINEFNIEQLQATIEVLLKGDVETAKKNHLFAPMQYDVDKIIENLGRVHLVFLLNEVKNKNIYHAINNYLGSRCRYPISVFTTEERLGNSYMSNGQLVEPVHDYRLINLQNFLKNEAENGI